MLAVLRPLNSLTVPVATALNSQDARGHMSAYSLKTFRQDIAALVWVRNRVLLSLSAVVTAPGSVIDPSPSDCTQLTGRSRSYVSLLSQDITKRYRRARL